MGGKKSDLISGYRIVAPHWENDALSGEGARKYGGRWNSPGRSMVYLGGSRALCALELLVHLTTPLSRAKPYLIIEVGIPKQIVSDYPPSILPDGWRKHPPGQLTMEIGDDWLQVGNQLSLRVPSVIIPEENNILLNPQHPDFSKIEYFTTTEFSFDPRLGG